MNTKPTQCARLLDAMKAGMSFTRMEAMLDLGIGNLPARILELRQRGEPVMDDWTQHKNRFGEAIKFKRYFLAKSAA